MLYFKVQCTSASRATVKEEVPKFLEKELIEQYLLYIKTINTLAKQYIWWTSAANGAPLAFKTVNRMLLDSTQDTWEDECNARPT
eukprot:4373416-Ditylum_brightwellii.AAC.1